MGEGGQQFTHNTDGLGKSRILCQAPRPVAWHLGSHTDTGTCFVWWELAGKIGLMGPCLFSGNKGQAEDICLLQGNAEDPLKSPGLGNCVSI